MNDEDQSEMPRYRSHKDVWALKIAAIDYDGPPDDRISHGATITPEEKGYAPFKVDAAYVSKHKPQAAGRHIDPYPWVRVDPGVDRALNHKAWAIGSLTKRGFKVRRVVWGRLLAREERRDGEHIRKATILVGVPKLAHNK
jgi:hypothetical protein